MRILVTGAAGFIGSSLSEYLATMGHEVIAVDMFLDASYSKEIKLQNWSELKRYSNITLIEHDLRQEITESFFDGVDTVVNEAAMPGLMKSWSNFEIYATCNIQLVENLIRTSTRFGVKHFIQISTSSVYGINAIGPENSITEPVSPYGVTKLAGEELIKTYNRTFGLNYTILRYFSVYGPRQRPDMAYNKIIRAVLNSEEFVIFGDGQQSRTNTYISDCLEATYATIVNRPFQETINISGSKEYSLLHAISIIEEAAGNKARIKFMPTRPGDQLLTNGNIEKAKRILGYNPKIELSEGLFKQLEWQKLHSRFKP
jgi:UDP-glucuronate 4-epimerase